MLATVHATRYVIPLREGGSLPALVEADAAGLYVVKLHGAGQGPRALAAEVIVGELARTLGLPMPVLKLVELDRELSRAEPDPEIQELLEKSAGTNIGLDFLPGALAFGPAELEHVPAELAANVVWLDAFVENVDRTPRNPNLLVWHGKPWLIDHGAALYRQHGGLDPAQAGGAFAAIKDHVLLPRAGSIVEADARLAPLVDRAKLEEIVAAVPEAWFAGADPQTYVDYLTARLDARGSFVEEAERAARAD